MLAKIFQQSLDLGCFPDDRKVGKVIPIHKAGDQNFRFNYRPISRTIPWKILEHIISSHLVNFLESNNWCFFRRRTRGFRKTFSCETQLLTFTHDLHVILDRSSQTNCMFLDFAKAFDKVSHNLLLYKLSSLNVESSIVSWFHAFLTNQSQLVFVNHTSSPFVSVTSGVPQVCVPCLLLFLIYINDLPPVFHPQFVYLPITVLYIVKRLMIPMYLLSNQI